MEAAEKNGIPVFPDKPIPMSVAAKVLGMNPDTVRNRMEDGTFDIGVIHTSRKKRGTRKYRKCYISPKKFYEFTGYIWDGKTD